MIQHEHTSQPPWRSGISWQVFTYIKVDQAGDLVMEKQTADHQFRAGYTFSLRELTFSCPFKCLISVISLKHLRAKMTLSNTLVNNLMAILSPEMESSAEMTSP